jgi:FMN phosphatase YigB (HAD superfamily)
LLALKVLPFVPDVLDKLKRIKANEVSLRLGVISNTGTETLSKMRSVIAKAGLLEFFDPALLLFSSVEGIDKRQKQFFELATQRAGAPPEHCVCVSEDDAERCEARSRDRRRQILGAGVAKQGGERNVGVV